MTKYHVNSQGEPGACSAEIQCPFGGDQQHYSSPANARQAFELSMAGETIKTNKKPKVSLAEESRKLYDPRQYENLPFDHVYYDEERRRKNAVRSGDYSHGRSLAEHMQNDYIKWDQMSRTAIPTKPERGVPARLLGEGTVISTTDPLTGNEYRAILLSPRVMGNIMTATFQDPRGNMVTADANELMDVVRPTKTVSPKWKKQNDDAAKLEDVRNRHNEDLVTRLLASD